MTPTSDMAGGGNVSGQVVSTACRVFGITEQDLFSSQRGDTSPARWAIAVVLNERVGWSFARIGRLLHKNHAAIIYGYRRACKMRENDETFYDALKLIEDSI
jgi:chromosomal replication initiation ATPase DnaA